MRYLCSFLISYGLGHLLVTWLWAGEKKPNPTLLFFLAAGVGLGLSSHILFYGFLVFDQLNRTAVIFSHLLLLLVLLMLCSSVRSKHKKWRWEPQGINLETNLFLLILGIAFIPLICQAAFYPLGGWDAWSVWNLKARFLFLGENHWRNLFDPILWRSSPHYPLFLPLVNVWGWIFSPSPEPMGPLLTSLLFSALTAGLTFSGLSETPNTVPVILRSEATKNPNEKRFGSTLLTILRTILSKSKDFASLPGPPITKAGAGRMTEKRDSSKILSLLAVLLMVTLPFFTKLASSQYCDIVLAYYLLGSFLCLIQARADNQKPFALLAGLFLGFLSFTKPEGTSAALLIFFLSLPYLFRRDQNLIDLCTTNDKKKPESKGRDTDYTNIGKEKVSRNQGLLISFFFGLTIGGLPTVLFELLYAPPNQTFINGLASTTEASSPFRLNMILSFFWVELKSEKWNGIWLLCLIGLILSQGKCFRPMIRIIPIFLFCYLLMIGIYYYVNTYFEIGWWLQVSLHRILFAILPCVVFWAFSSIEESS